jgi:hypothetical protein
MVYTQQVVLQSFCSNGMAIASFGGINSQALAASHAGYNAVEEGPT